MASPEEEREKAWTVQGSMRESFRGNLTQRQGPPALASGRSMMDSGRWFKFLPRFFLVKPNHFLPSAEQQLAFSI